MGVLLLLVVLVDMVLESVWPCIYGCHGFGVVVLVVLVMDDGLVVIIAVSV